MQAQQILPWSLSNLEDDLTRHQVSFATFSTKILEKRYYRVENIVILAEDKVEGDLHDNFSQISSWLAKPCVERVIAYNNWTDEMVSEAAKKEINIVQLTQDIKNEMDHYDFCTRSFSQKVLFRKSNSSLKDMIRNGERGILPKHDDMWLNFARIKEWLTVPVEERLILYRQWKQ